VRGFRGPGGGQGAAFGADRHVGGTQPPGGGVTADPVAGAELVQRSLPGWSRSPARQSAATAAWVLMNRYVGRQQSVPACVFAGGYSVNARIDGKKTVCVLRSVGAATLYV